jgi:hypothetical protein
VSVNLIFLINYHNGIDILKKEITMAEGYRFSLYVLKFESVIGIEFHATEAYSRLDLTKVKHTNSKLSVVIKETLRVRINPRNFIACEKQK